MEKAAEYEKKQAAAGCSSSSLNVCNLSFYGVSAMAFAYGPMARWGSDPFRKLCPSAAVLKI